MKPILACLLLLLPASSVSVAAQGRPAAAAAAAGPAGPAPRAADGHPDLTGVWWPGADVGVANLRVGAPGDRNPWPPRPGSIASLYQPWAMELAKTMGEKDDPALHCVPSVTGSGSGLVTQILQTPQFVAELTESFHGFRLIPTEPGRQHNAEAVPSYHGDAVGRWDGNTLVVDVTNFNDKNWLVSQGAVSFHSDQLHATERWTRVDAGTLVIEQTYEDPKVLTAPWTYKRTLKLAPFDQVMEALCFNTETASLMEVAAKQNYGVQKK